MNRTRAVALIPTLALLGLAPAAQAKTICVADPACTGTKATTIQEALDKARSAGFAGADKVRIGPGTFSSGDSITYSAIAGENVEIAGAGDATVLRADSSSKSGDWTVLELNAGTAQVSVHDLAIEVPEHMSVSPGRTAGLLAWNVTADRLSISGPGTAGAELEGGSVLRASRVNMSGEAVAVNVRSGGGSVLDSSLAAWRGVWAQESTSVRRSRIQAVREGVRADGTTARVSDSVLRTTGADAPALAAAGGTNAAAAIQASRVTTVGAADGGSAVRAASSSSGPADVTIDNSIITGYPKLFLRSSAGAAATITARSVAVPGSATGVGPSTGLTIEDLITANPAFVNAAAGDYRLSGSSPLIDRPGSAPVVTVGPWDVAGAQRTVDGNRDGKAVTDLGAFEYRPPAPVAVQTSGSTAGASRGTGAGPSRRDTAAPRLTGLRVVKRSLRLRLSETARVTVTVQRRRGRAWKATRKVRRRLVAGRRTIALPRLKAGRYRLAVTAVDAAGNRSAIRRVALKVAPRRR